MRLTKKIVPLSLALPGGGTHGAFTWGVLDVLLEDGRFELDAISAVGSGVVNALILASEWHHGGTDAARSRLTEFWRDVAFGSTPERPVFPRSRLNEDRFAEVLAPFGADEVDPLTVLSDRIYRYIDFAALRETSVRVFVAAANVVTGNLAIFDSKQSPLYPAMVLASACTPFACLPVRIDGQYYWGDGFVGTPPLIPLIDEAESVDILLVDHGRRRTYHLPNTALEIFERLNDVAQSASLHYELRTVSFIQRLVSDGQVGPRQYKSPRMHRIDGASALLDVGGGSSESRTRADPDFIQALFLRGREEAAGWLNKHARSVGRRSTMGL